MRENIIPANASHILGIMKLSAKVEMKGMSEKEREAHGFLVSGFSEADYQDFLKRADIFEVLIVEDKIRGFLIVYSDQFMEDDDQVKKEVLKRIEKPFMIIKQICIDPDSGKKGFGRKMYENLFQKVKDIPLLAAIALEPYNPVSIKFHEKMGFRKLFEFLPSDNMLRSMWIKE